MKRILKLCFILVCSFCSVFFPLEKQKTSAEADSGKELFVINGKAYEENEYETIYEIETLSVQKSPTGGTFDLLMGLEVFDEKETTLIPQIVKVFRDSTEVKTKKINASSAGNYTVEYYAQSTTYRVVFFRREIVIVGAPKLYFGEDLLAVSETFSEDVISAFYQSEDLNLKEGETVPDTAEKYLVVDYYGNVLDGSVGIKNETGEIVMDKFSAGEMYERVYEYTDTVGNKLFISEKIRFYGDIVIFQDGEYTDTALLSGKLKKGSKAIEKTLPGYEIVDSFGNLLEFHITDDGGLNMNKSGEYTLIGYFSDSAGNRLEISYRLTIYEDTFFTLLILSLLALAVISSALMFIMGKGRLLAALRQKYLLVQLFCWLFGASILFVQLLSGIFSGFIYTEADSFLQAFGFLIICFSNGCTLYNILKKSEGRRWNE